MKTALLLIERKIYTSQTSLGDLYIIIDGKRERFSFTLEDTARPGNIKVKGETCIPECIVKVGPYVRPNGDLTIIFYTENDGVTLKVGPLKWSYILAHGGNTHIDTEGCLLVAKNKLSDIKIQGSLMKELRTKCDELWKAGYEIKAQYVNLTQLT